MDIREREAREDMQKRKAHADREDKIFQPLANQVYQYMNPPNRRVQQYLAGSKSVKFILPDETFRLKANVHADPAWRPLADTVHENAFHDAAQALLGHSQSAPSLQGGLPQPPFSAPAAFGRSSEGGLVPRARSRQVLDPTQWSQVRLQGTRYGKLAQVAEESSHLESSGSRAFRRMRRGGSCAHLPDETDKIAAAGTRKHRVMGHHDKGVLRGEFGHRGESSGWKTDHGSSSAAPLQDHFTFDVGHAATNLEFPLGKKMWPEFH
jgi:hypothetical protein